MISYEQNSSFEHSKNRKIKVNKISHFRSPILIPFAHSQLALFTPNIFLFHQKINGVIIIVGSIHNIKTGSISTLVTNTDGEIRQI